MGCMNEAITDTNTLTNVSSTLISQKHYTLQIDPCRVLDVGPGIFTHVSLETPLLSSSSHKYQSASHLFFGRRARREKKRRSESTGPFS